MSFAVPEIDPEKLTPLLADPENCVYVELKFIVPVMLPLVNGTAIVDSAPAAVKRLEDEDTPSTVLVIPD